MSFIGNKPDSFGYTSTSYEQFSGDNSNTTFTLSKYVTNSSDIQVVVNNVIQEPVVAYTVVDLNSLVFSSAPSTGTNNIYVVYKNFIQTGLGFAANSVGSQTITPGSIQNYHFGNISIPNSSLSNSSITINGTSIGLGGSGNIPGANVTNIPNSSLSNSSITINGTSIGLGSSGSIAAGTTITDDTSTNATRYVMLGTATSGAYTTANVSSTKLTFNPSTGILGSVGLKFPATQVSSVDVNTLDDYEEGTWTPNIDNAYVQGATVSYTQRAGWYRKVGNLVTVGFKMVINTYSVGGGPIHLGGLPFNIDHALDGSKGTTLGPAMISGIAPPANTTGLYIGYIKNDNNDDRFCFFGKSTGTTTESNALCIQSTTSLAGCIFRGSFSYITS